MEKPIKQRLIESFKLGDISFLTEADRDFFGKHQVFHRLSCFYADFVIDKAASVDEITSYDGVLPLDRSPIPNHVGAMPEFQAMSNIVETAINGPFDSVSGWRLDKNLEGWQRFLLSPRWPRGGHLEAVHRG